MQEGNHRGILRQPRCGDRQVRRIPDQAFGGHARRGGTLAEAAHSLADTGNQALLLFGSNRAKRPADRVHPFGYGPERYFWSFVVALVLFGMGRLFALYEGINKLGNPHEIDNAIVAFAILGFAIVLGTYSLRTEIVEADNARDRHQSWWHFIRHAKSPELPVVLLEDVGAQTGLVIALDGLSMAEVAIETSMREAMPFQMTIYIEPYIHRSVAE